jgi:hypothetical protein
MIKKLFTLLTLALLAMPLAWGADYYLVGSFTNWEANAAYKFSKVENTDTYTLTKTVNDNFKIIKVEEGQQTVWYGAANDNVSYISGLNHNNMEMNSNNGPNYYLKNSAETTFSFTVSNNTPSDLCVNRNGTLYIQGFDDWNNNVAMTQTSTGWTISKHIDVGQEFRFVDEFGENIGTDNGSNWWIFNNTNYNSESGQNNINSLDGRELGLQVCNYVFNMRHTGDYVLYVVLDVEGNLSKLVVMPTLATIQNNGVAGSTYLIGDDLQVVYVNADNELAFAHDLNESVVNCPSDKVDYMTAVAKEHTGSWKQYNWVMLDFYQNGTEMSKLNKVADKDEPIHKIIKGGTLKGVFQNAWNHYAIQVSDNATITTADPTANFVPNVYCPANFGATNGVQTGYKVEYTTNGVTVDEQTTVDYWFMTPKSMEVFELSGALYYSGTAPDNQSYSSGFYMERSWQRQDGKWFNPAGLKGGIGLNTACNSDNQPALSAGNSYRFLTVAWCPVVAPTYGAPLRDDIPLNQLYYPESGSTLNPAFQAGALDLTGAEGQIVTAVSEVKSGSEVVSVTYCDLAGRMSQKPFAGVNIIVTRYSDGTVKTTKAIK